MTRIIIEDLRNRSSLLAALNVVLEVMNTDGAFEQEEHVFAPTEQETSPDTAADEVTRSRGEPYVSDLTTAPWNQPRPLPYVPCPARGEHQSLTDCWRCWSDVVRGASLEPEVIDGPTWWGSSSESSLEKPLGSDPRSVSDSS